MARKAIAKDQIVKLIVGAGQASPSPPVGPALGSKGVKSMDFCKVITTSQLHTYTATDNAIRNSTRAQHTTTPAHRYPPASQCAQTAPSISRCARLPQRHYSSLLPASRPPRARSAAREMYRGR